MLFTPTKAQNIRETKDSFPKSVLALDELFDMPVTKTWVDSACLHDAEQVLLLRPAVGLHAAVYPARGPVRGLLKPARAMRKRCKLWAPKPGTCVVEATVTHAVPQRWATAHRSGLVLTLETTSSRAMMMSAPAPRQHCDVGMHAEWSTEKFEHATVSGAPVTWGTGGKVPAPSLFWTSMECSGVSIMGAPSTGDWKRTPCSVTSARCSRDTICASRVHHMLCRAVSLSAL